MTNEALIAEARKRADDLRSLCETLRCPPTWDIDLLTGLADALDASERQLAAMTLTEVVSGPTYVGQSDTEKLIAEAEDWMGGSPEAADLIDRLGEALRAFWDALESSERQRREAEDQLLLTRLYVKERTGIMLGTITQVGDEHLIREAGRERLP